jgi:GR25 family glycosyltransferase involved in LPS biosynthesis
MQMYSMKQEDGMNFDINPPILTTNDFQGERIFVINMKNNGARREKVKRNLANLGIKGWNLFDAIIGKNLEHKDCQELVDADHYYKAKNIPYRETHANHNMGSIGCFKSHYEIWRKIVEGKHDWYIIMEDDVEIPHSFIKELIYMVNHTKFGRNPEVGMIQLGTTPSPLHQDPKPFKKVFKNMQMKDNHHGVKLMNRSFYGTSCYLISKAFAEALIDRIDEKKPNIQVDSWLASLRKDNYPIWLSLKPLTKLSVLSMTSDIKHSHVRAKTAKERFQSFYNFNKAMTEVVLHNNKKS